jgi:pyridoxamine 5'-phosphate oxidase family protein
MAAIFTEAEQAYLASQRLARLATVSPEGQPDVAVVSFRFDGERFAVGGHRLRKTLKYKNALRNGLVSLVVDDVETFVPWAPRGVKVHGRAEMKRDSDGREFIAIVPDTKWSWGINEPTFTEGHEYVMTKATREESKEQPS